MKIRFSRQLGSLALKISAFVVGIELLFFIINSAISIGNAYKKAIANAYKEIDVSMNYSLDWVDSRLQMVELATKTTALHTDMSVTNPEVGKECMKELFNSCEYISAVTLEFVPGCCPSIPNISAPTIVQKEGTDSIISLDIADAGYDYTDPKNEDINWYYGMRGQSSWTQPYMSYSDSILRVAYSHPIFDNNGKVFAVLCSTVTLDWVNKVFEESKPHPDSKVSVISSEGRYIYRLSSQEGINKDALSYASQANNTQMIDVLKRMMRGEKGTANVDSPEKVFLSYSPIKRTGWSVCYVYPISLIQKEPMTMAKTMFLQGLAIMLLIFIILSLGIYYLIRPFTNNLKKVTESNAAMNQDLKIASKLQQTMLPKQSFEPIGCNQLEVFGLLRPAKMVGGDLYDYFFKSGKIYFCVGDVSGKGVPASMYMAIIRILVREIANREAEVDRILLHLNQSVTKSDNSMFCTIFLGAIDLATGEMSYCSAGHNPPIIIRNTTEGRHAEYLSVIPSAAVGVFDDEEYSSNKITLNHNDSVFLYTDGVTEAEDINHNLFGEKETIRIIETMPAFDNVRMVVETMLSAVDKHATGALQSDDITMLMLKFVPNDTLTLTNDTSLTGRLGEWVETMCRRHGLPKERLFNIQLAVEEAVVNVMNYSYPGQKNMPIYIKVIDDGDVNFIVEDEGVPYNPLENESPELDASTEDCQIGGLGVFLYTELLDGVEYKYEGNRNVLTMKVKK